MRVPLVCWLVIRICLPRLSWVVVFCRFFPWYGVFTGCEGRCVRRWFVGGCFLLLWWGFLISGASDACRTLGLCTYHAFFSLLNVFVHRDGCCVCGHRGRGTMGLCLICVAIVCLLITGAWLGFLMVSCMLLYQSIVHLPVALGGCEFFFFCRRFFVGFVNDPLIRYYTV